MITPIQLDINIRIIEQTECFVLGYAGISDLFIISFWLKS